MIIRSLIQIIYLALIAIKNELSLTNTIAMYQAGLQDLEYLDAGIEAYNKGNRINTEARKTLTKTLFDYEQQEETDN